MLQLPCTRASCVVQQHGSAFSAAMRAGVAECGAAVQCLTLFRQYPFHNLLHHQVWLVCQPLT